MSVDFSALRPHQLRVVAEAGTGHATPFAMISHEIYILPCNEKSFQLPKQGWEGLYQVQKILPLSLVAG
jgi:hypothetical protein